MKIEKKSTNEEHRYQIDAKTTTAHTIFKFNFDQEPVYILVMCLTLLSFYQWLIFIIISFQ